jgi:hypothetical protein
MFSRVKRATSCRRSRKGDTSFTGGERSFGKKFRVASFEFKVQKTRTRNPQPVFFPFLYFSLRFLVLP